MTRLIRLVGADNDYLYFDTPSWSGKDETYDLTVDRRTGELTCSCFGALRWKKTVNVMNPEGGDTCKHQRSLLRRFADILAQDQDE